MSQEKEEFFGEAVANLDHTEGKTIENMRRTHTTPYADPILEVPEDLKRNVAITTVDTLLNWSRKSALWPVAFGLACCAFEMMASAMSRG